MNIIFMGTPDFACPTLKNLIADKKHNIAAVFTQQPKAKNRGLNLTKSPVHQIANKHNIDVYTPSSLRSSEVIELIKNINADIIIVVAYGFIIPKEILYCKKYGAINLHPSDLPKYRGAAPLQHTIINQEKESAICVIKMDEGLDTGDILIKKSFPLPNDITLNELHEKTANEGANLVNEVISNINQIKPIPQNKINFTTSYASKLSKKDGEINPILQNNYQIDAKIRGLNPWPGTYYQFSSNDNIQNKLLLIKSRTLNQQNDKIEIQNIMQNISQNNLDNLSNLIIFQKKLFLLCKENSLLEILQLKIPGKNIISGKEYIDGYLYRNCC